MRSYLGHFLFAFLAFVSPMYADLSNKTVDLVKIEKAKPCIIRKLIFPEIIIIGDNSTIIHSN